MLSKLYYFHDPMCSWCYAFRPAWRQIKASLPDKVKLIYLLGGLAPDSDVPMPQEMRDYIQSHWQHIEEVVPGTKFNYDFWRNCQPRRATYPACRAVLAARRQGMADDRMIDAIQDAYYLHARNPADTDTLVALASELGLDKKSFLADLISDDLDQELIAEIHQSRKLGAMGFPSLVLVSSGGSSIPIPIDYNNPEKVLNAIRASATAV